MKDPSEHNSIKAGGFYQAQRHEKRADAEGERLYIRLTAKGKAVSCSSISFQVMTELG